VERGLDQTVRTIVELTDEEIHRALANAALDKAKLAGRFTVICSLTLDDVANAASARCIIHRKEKP
jgi:hypothetical protein